MDVSLITTIISTGGAVIVGIFGMFVTNNQIGKRIDDLRQDSTKNLDLLREDSTKNLDSLRQDFGFFRQDSAKNLDSLRQDFGFFRQDSAKNLDLLRQDLRDLRSEFHDLKDTMSGKFAQLDLEIAKLMDK